MFRPLLLFLVGLVLVASSGLRAQDDPVSRRAAIQAMYPVMIQALEQKAFGRARNICEQAILWEPQNAIHHYNMACIEAQAGRLPKAMGALELAVALGFNDPQHLQTDPDLAPLRNEAKFAELVRKVTTNAFAPQGFPGASSSKLASNPDTPSSSGTTSNPGISATASASRKGESPAPNSFQDRRPVGLFFMTRFWAANNSLEKAAWYFAPDGTVYQNLQSGFSAEDLRAHAGPKGQCKPQGDKLEVTWSDGKKTSSTIKVSASGTGFSWNAGIFSAVKLFEKPADLVGVYEGGESLAGASGNAIVSKRLELRADGTFSWSGISFASVTSDASRISVAGNDASTGRWELSGASVTLTNDKGVEVRRIVFPYDDENTPVKPDRVFFGGLLYKKR
jgi:hypothetical protein